MVNSLDALPNQIAPAQSAAEPIQLIDIKEPPLADNFYLTPLDVIAALIVVSLAVLIFRQIRQHRQKNAPRKAAIAALKALAKPSASEINLLLKRYVRSVAPAHPALIQTGDTWQLFLTTSVANNPYKIPDISALLYQAHSDETATHEFYQFAQFWLSHIKTGALNA
jgi:hypothetical protein